VCGLHMHVHGLLGRQGLVELAFPCYCFVNSDRLHVLVGIEPAHCHAGCRACFMALQHEVSSSNACRYSQSCQFTKGTQLHNCQ